MYNRHRLLGPHWQEEGEVGDLEHESLQPLNSELDGAQVPTPTSAFLVAPVRTLAIGMARADKHAYPINTGCMEV